MNCSRKETAMQMVSSFVKSRLFRLKWLFMSPEIKYAYLWNRTRHSRYGVPRGSERPARW
ncbi:hypothetical protein ACFLTL_01280 [Chloroflexota bacterium]